MRKRYDMFDPREGLKKAAAVRKLELDIQNLKYMIKTTLDSNPIRQQYINRLFAKDRELKRLNHQLGGVMI